MKINKISEKRALKQLEALKNEIPLIRLAGERWETPFQTLISIILSARTRDEITIKVCKNLFDNFPTVEKLSKAKLKKIEKLINPINFYHNKSKNILNCTKEIIKRFDSKVPKNFEELISLPGVGRKTANVFLSEFNHDAIGVDTHVNYISNYLKWVNSKKPEIVEESLKELFPKKIWSEINPILVRFGKTHTSKIKKNDLLDKIKKIR